MLVHFVKAVQHGSEVVWADGKHGGETDGGVHRVAPAHPVPEAEHIRCVDSELGHFLGVSRNGHEMPRNGFLFPAETLSNHSRAVCALVIVSSVVKVFEETMKRVSAGSRSRTASAKSVLSTLETKRKVIERSL